MSSVTSRSGRQEQRRYAKKIFAYPSTIDTSTQELSTHSYTYIKYNISTNKRNPILLAVPTMYAVAHSGQRRHVSETYDSVCVNTSRIKSAHHILQRSTIPHGRNTMPTLVKYLTPDVYGETLINDFILSPFHHNNRRFYRFSISSFAGSHSTSPSVQRCAAHSWLLAKPPLKRKQDVS